MRQQSVPLQLRSRQQRGSGVAGITHALVDDFRCIVEDVHRILGDESFVPPFACEFSSADPSILAVADEDGAVRLYDTARRGARAAVNDWSAHSNAVFDLAWMPGERKLLSASGDQTAVLWDVASESRVTVLRGHASSVKSVAFARDDGNVVATGSRDGSVMLWDLRTNASGAHHRAVTTIPGAHACRDAAAPPAVAKPRRRGAADASNAPSVTCVVFQDDRTLVSAGAVDGVVKAWDLRRSGGTRGLSPRLSLPYAGEAARTRGFSNLTFDSTRTRLFASCMDSTVYEYDLAGAAGGAPVARFARHLNSSFYVKAALSPDDSLLLTGSSDDDAYVYRVARPREPPCRLRGHAGEVTSVAWCPTDFAKVVTCGDDNAMMLWRLRRPRDDDDDEDEIVGRAERMPETPDAATEHAPDAPRQAARLPTVTAETSPPRDSSSRAAFPASFGKQLLLTSLVAPQRRASTQGGGGGTKRKLSLANAENRPLKVRRSSADTSPQATEREAETPPRSLVKNNGSNSLLNNDRLYNLPNNNGLNIQLKNNRLNSPLKNNGLIIPLKNNGQHSPSKNNGMNSFSENNGMNSPSKNNGLNSRLKNNGLNIPLKNNGVNSPLKENGTNSPHDTLTTPANPRATALRVLEFADGAALQSPTANLPNLVVDGQPPVKLCRAVQAVPRKPAANNWLTRLGGRAEAAGRGGVAMRRKRVAGAARGGVARSSGDPGGGVAPPGDREVVSGSPSSRGGSGRSLLSYFSKTSK